MKPEILTAWGEKCSGPGWTNNPLWVVTRHFTTAQGWHLVVEAIQPEAHNDEIRTLFDISADLNREMIKAVKKL